MVRAEPEQSRSVCDLKFIPIAVPVDVVRLYLFELVPVLEEVNVYFGGIGQA